MKLPVGRPIISEFTRSFFQPAVGLTGRLEVLVCSEPQNIIYGAWWNGFRFLGLGVGEFTMSGVLTSSFVPPAPSPSTFLLPYLYIV